MAVLRIRDKIDLEYFEFGEGDKYILSMDFRQSPGESYLTELARRGYHVFGVVERGYGKGTHVFEDYGEEWYNIWADDLVSFADTLGIDKFAYTGHSNGAGVGWHICLRHPERVIAFMPIAGGPHSKNGEETDSISEFSRSATIAAAKKGGEVWKKYAEDFVEYYKVPLTGDESEEEKAIIESVNKEWAEGFINMTPEEGVINPRKPLPWCKTEEELIEELSKITVPTLHLGALHDEIIKPENILRSAYAVKGSKVVFYEDCHHGIPEQKLTEAVNEMILFFKEKRVWE